MTGPDFMRGWPALVLGAAVLGALVYAAVLALLWWSQERLIFQPVTLPANHRFELGPDVHETWVDVPGARLHALHLRLPRPDGVVFFLHGNAGNLESWFVNADFYRRANFDLFMIDFRGYGKSNGRVRSEAELMADVRAAWAQIAPQYKGLRRVIYGRSLGSGLAAMLAAEVQPELTVLATPYSSMCALVRDLYPWVPPGLLRYPLRTDLALPRVKGPVLMVHGAHDELIPVAHSTRLAALAPAVKLLLLPEAGHNDIQMFPAYLDALAAALRAP